MVHGVTLQDVRQNPVIRKHVIGLILCGIALFLDIALSFSPMFWYYKNDVIEVGGTKRETTTSIGLWKGCSMTQLNDNDPQKGCVEHDDAKFFLLYLGKDGVLIAKSTGATQLFQCNGLLFMVIAVVATSMKLFFLRDNNLLVPLAAAHAFWGAVSLIGSAGAFGVGLKNASTFSMDLTENLNFSFAFAVISGLVGLAGAIALLIAAKSNEAE